MKNRDINIEDRMISSKLGIAVKYHRKKKGMSLAELESRTGISAGYLCRVENGKRRNVSIPIIQSLSEVLEVNLFQHLNLNSDEKAMTDIEEALINLDFSINGQDISTKGRELIISIVNFTVKEMGDMNTNLKKHSDLLQQVNELQTELNRDSLER